MKRTTNDDSRIPDVPIVSTESDETVPEFTAAQRLAWELCDGVIADREFRQLENLLRESDDARSEYLSVVSMHQSLIEIFNPQVSGGSHGLLPI